MTSPPVRAPLTARALFETYFWPLYPPDVQRDLAGARAREANPGGNPGVLGHLDDAARVFQGMAPRAFGEDLGLDRSDASVHRLSVALTQERRDAWAAHGQPGSADSELFNVVVHGAAYLGACVVSGHGGSWRVRRPLWESLVHLRSRAGSAELPVFHWWLKSLADEAFADGGSRLVDRYRAYVEIPCARPEELPILATPNRKLPRLAAVRYDTLHRHLLAHLPELRDLGEHFPSPERLSAYRFQWLDFALLGGGRMLLMMGLGDGGGAHLFWLTAAGFDKSLLVPCEPFPAPVLRTEGDKVVLLVSRDGRPQTHEWLWWGP